MTLRILINGATGRMGQLSVKTLTTEPDITLTAQLSSSDNLEASIREHHPDIVLDFTRADIAKDNLNTIMANNARPVIGTSGLTMEDIRAVQKRFPSQGGIIVPNFSVAAVLAMKYASEIAHYFPEVEIIEMHHDGKLDSPSGTAIRAAELLAANRKRTKKPARETREIIKGARGAMHCDIPIHAIRLPGLVAHLQIMFGGLGETLTLRHDTIDRQCFMPGVVLACRKVMTLDHLVYGLEEIL